MKTICFAAGFTATAFNTQRRQGLVRELVCAFCPKRFSPFAVYEALLWQALLQPYCLLQSVSTASMMSGFLPPDASRLLAACRSRPRLQTPRVHLLHVERAFRRYLRRSSFLDNYALRVRFERGAGTCPTEPCRNEVSTGRCSACKRLGDNSVITLPTRSHTGLQTSLFR